MRPFRRKTPGYLSVGHIVRLKKQTFAYCRDIISSLVVGISTVIANIIPATVGYTAYAIATVLANVLVYAATTVLSTVASMLLSKKPASQEVSNNGRMFNTRSTDEPLHLVYGQAKVGTNWVYCETNATQNRHLSIVSTFGEGEIEGFALGNEATPIASNINNLTPLYNISIGGSYTGTEAGQEYVVKIDNMSATPNTFKWSDDGGSTWEATGIPIVADAWVDLNNEMKIKFPVAQGHSLNDQWSFHCGKGLFLGERLSRFYNYYKELPVSYVQDLLLADNLHTGAAEQAVDGDIQAACPAWLDALHNTAHEFVKLKWNVSAWNSIPEVTGIIKGIKIKDTRAPANPKAWQHIGITNGSLVAYDFMTLERYGMGIAESEMDADSFNEVANWCDTNGYTFNGAVIARQSFLDNLDDILVNFRAFRSGANGKYKIRVYDDDTAVMALGEDDFLLEEGVTISQPGVPESPTKVKCVFINRNKNYTTDYAEWPQGSTLPDDEERLLEIPLIGTDNMLQALKLAKFYYLRAQFNKTFSIMAHPRCFALERGDMITLTSTFLGWTARKVRVFSIGIPERGWIPLVVQEEDSSIYDQTVNVQEDVPTAPPPIVNPYENPSQVTGVALHNAGTYIDSVTGTTMAKVMVEWTDNAADENIVDYEVLYQEKQTDVALPASIPVNYQGAGHESAGHVPAGHGGAMQLNWNKQ